MPKKSTKSKKSSKRVQGQQASTRQLSNKREKHQPRTQDRGIGSSYAYAVGNVVEEAKNMKGSQTNFLGVEKVTLNPKEFANTLLSKKVK